MRRRRQQAERESGLNKDRIPQTGFRVGACVPTGGWCWCRLVCEVCEVCVTITEAVKLPLMWKLWSHGDVNGLPETQKGPVLPALDGGQAWRSLDSVGEGGGGGGGDVGGEWCLWRSTYAA